LHFIVALKVEEVKKQESKELNKLNKKYMDLDNQQRFLIQDVSPCLSSFFQNDHKGKLIGRYIHLRRERHVRQKIFGYFKNFAKFSKVIKQYTFKAEKEYEVMAKGEFLQRWKKQTDVAGNKLYNKKMRETVSI
jgi:hypothetical protein